MIPFIKVAKAASAVKARLQISEVYLFKDDFSRAKEQALSSIEQLEDLVTANHAAAVGRKEH